MTDGTPESQAIPEQQAALHHRGAYEEELARRMPLFVRRVFHVGCGRGLAERLLRARTGIALHGVEGDGAAAAEARSYLDSVIEGTADVATLPFSPGFFDCVIVSNPSAYGPALVPTLEGLAALLSPTGLLLVRVPGAGPRGEDISGPLLQAGFRVYDTWPYLEAGGTDEGVVCAAVRHDYDPIPHARACRLAGRPDWGHQILSLALNALLLNGDSHRLSAPALGPTNTHGGQINGDSPHLVGADVETKARMTAEKQACILAMDREGDPLRRLLLFNGALVLFYQVTEILPACHQVYLNQAEFWRRIGDDDMAARLLRTVNHVAPHEEVARQIEVCGASGAPRPTEMVPPSWEPPDPRPRVLFITQPQSHYGLDVLYDGLCAVLGDDQVIEHPWKPMLHGQTPREMEQYPCAVDRAGGRMELEDILARLRAGYFDVVLFGDLDKRIGLAEIRALVQAAGSTPWFLMDAQDECTDFFRDALEFLGLEAVCGYFKREMLACFDYGPRVAPFPFAYPDHRVPLEVSGPRPQLLFYAGQRWCGLRELYLGRIEALLGETFDRTYDQDGYVEAMRRSLMGLSAFGGGFDTVRYWELPANGCMLLSERLPIRVPYDFKDGETAVLFDDLPELEEKVKHYAAHRDEAEAIARAGHEHLKRRHTGSARARQVLGWIQAMMRG